jgi:hypothetical protein
MPNDLAHFAIHADGTGDSAADWSVSPVPTGFTSDDHINLKADSAGRVYAALKTGESSAGSPQIVLSVRSPTGTWSHHPVGQVSEPVQSQFGFHLVRVDSREGDEAEARHILVPIELSDAAEDRLLEHADSLDVLGRSLTLTASAEALGLEVRTADLTRELPVWPGIGDMHEGVDWAFDDITERGEVSPLFESPEAFYMLELVDRYQWWVVGASVVLVILINMRNVRSA